MASISTTTLHERADALAMAGDFVGALAHAAEALRVAPQDYRARIKVGLCLSALGQNDAAVATLCVVAEGLWRGGFVLSAIGACRDVLSLSPEAAAPRDILRRIHGSIRGLEPKTKARVPPPIPPTSTEDAEGTFLRPPSPEALIGAAAQLATTDSEAPATPVEAVGVPLFSELSADVFVSLVEKLAYLKLPPEHPVVSEGAEGTSLFMLLAGEAKVEKQRDGQTIELARLSAGSLFGEMALLTSKPRSATITTTQPAELFELDRKTIEEVAAAHPAVTEEIVRFARRRLLMNLMNTSKVFAAFDAAQRAQVLKAFVSRVVPVGERIIREGDAPSGLYVVLEGEVEVAKHDPAGDKVVLAYLREGDVFGEIGLLLDQAATATVVAVEKSVVLWLAKEKFTALVAAHPQVKSFLDSLSLERLEELDHAMSADGIVLDADDLMIL